ncbi:MAG: D-alanyl-D-alanine carboxypeptidase family protein [Clostridia bacterium]|nr:D-alanyl-D-alanine carboxypeptidase family protein [Clostridia bacterium]
MEERRSPSLLLIVAYITLALLIGVAVWLGVTVSRLNREVQVVKSLTPTPLPAYGNVMQVTIDPNAPTPEPVIRTGMSGETVWKLQERLQALGYYTGTLDGQFGPATFTAVQLFQQQHGLDADGVVGPATSAMLYSPQAHQVIVTPSPTPAPTAVRQAGTLLSGQPMLVNREVYLPDNYEPVELVNMLDYCDQDIVTIKGSDIKGERAAVDALMTMLLAAHQDDLTIWQVSAGYRTVAYQQKLYDEKVYEYRQQGFSGANARSAASKTVAVPGTSEHHLGLAFDITVPGKYFIDTQQAVWLAENCWDYGFILRYQKDKEDITGYVYEPWHIRYVGTEHSLIMRDEHLCLEEYIEKYWN